MPGSQPAHRPEGGGGSVLDTANNLHSCFPLLQMAEAAALVAVLQLVAATVQALREANTNARARRRRVRPAGRAAPPEKNL